MEIMSLLFLHPCGARHDGKPEGWVGMPAYHAHGSFHFNNMKLRFLVLDRWVLWALNEKFLNLSPTGSVRILRKCSREERSRFHWPLCSTLVTRFPVLEY